MNDIARRHAIKLSLAAFITPSIGWSANKQITSVTAENYYDSGMKGFVIDKVDKRGQDISYFDALATTSANVARVFFQFKKCKNCTQFGRSPNDVEALRRILDWARARHIKIIVVATFEGQDKPSFWYDEALRMSFVKNWEWFASTFQNDTALAGLDIMNEPNPPLTNGSLADSQRLWQSLAELAITSIRATGVTLPIIFECVGGAQSIGFRDFVPFKDSQVVYSIHLYTPHAITHQHVSPMWSRTIPYPAGPEWKLRDSVLLEGEWNRKRLELALNDVIGFYLRYKVPIFVGEFSCVRWAPNDSAFRYISDCLEIFKKFGWSWCYHEFRGWPGWDAEISSEDRSTSVRSFDAPTMKLILAEMR